MKTQIFSKYFFLFATVLFGISCSSTDNLETRKHSDPSIVAVIDQTEISYAELVKGFSKNLNDSLLTQDELKEFLPNYVEYRMKLKEGKERGFDTNIDLLEEYEQFARQAATSYWLENDLKSNRIDTFIQRSAYELKAFHILIEADEETSDQEEIFIHNRLLEARKDLYSGVNPEDVNLEYSSKRDGRPMGGELPWVTASRTVAPFEDALFSLEPGEISTPVKTQFGYHIILLKDKRERSQDRRTSHLFIASRENNEHLEYIQSAYDSLAIGIAWETVVEQFTEDRRTLSSGGDIGWVGYGMQFPENFVDEVMKMDTSLPFSEPIIMDYGAQIIRIDSVRTFENDEMKQTYAEEELRRTGRLTPGDEDILERLKLIGGFTVHNELLRKTIQSLHSNTIENHTKSDSVLVTFNNESYTTADFLRYLKQTNKGSAESVETNYYAEFANFTDELVNSALVALTTETFPDFKDQMNTFKNDLIVFKVNEDLLWSVDAAEESMLRSHYELHKETYKTQTTYQFSRLSSASDSLLTEAFERITSGTPPELIAEQDGNISITSASVSNPSSELFRTFTSMNTREQTSIEADGNGYYFYILTDAVPVRQMTFNEAREFIFNDIQPEHEKAIMDSLKKKYSIQLFPGNIQ